MLKLNIGCGKQIFDGWENIDLYQPGCLKYDARDLENVYAKNSVDEIHASDVLEHFSHLEVDRVLKSWCSLLKPGGKIYIRVPDTKKQVEMFTSGTWSIEIFRHMVYGGQEQPGNFHCTAFTADLLKSMLLQNNILSNISFAHQGITSDLGTSSNPNIEANGIKKATHIGSQVTGLGDVLLLTPLCRQTPCLVELPKKAERFAFLFDGLAAVQITDNAVHSPDLGDDHFARCKLRAAGLNVDDYLPRIDTQIDKETEGIIWCNSVSTVHRHLRELPKNIELEVLSKLSNLKITKADPNIQLKEKIEIFKKSGKYVGCDTGDYHLMLALGGKCLVLVPDDCPDYRHARWHYNSPMVRYIPFKDWQVINENYVSNFFG